MLVTKEFLGTIWILHDYMPQPWFMGRVLRNFWENWEKFFGEKKIWWNWPQVGADVSVGVGVKIYMRLTGF